MSTEPSQVTKSRFEIERDGQVCWLAYETDVQRWISLLHTEIPPELRGRGIANELAHMAFEHAKENHLKVEVICPVIFHFLQKHPEYKALTGARDAG